MAHSFTARYPGRCGGCDDGIEVGEVLTYDEDNVVIHADCAPNPERISKPPEVCPRCFLAKAENGSCGCD